MTDGTIYIFYKYMIYKVSIHSTNIQTYLTFMHSILPKYTWKDTQMDEQIDR